MLNLTSYWIKAYLIKVLPMCEQVKYNKYGTKEVFSSQ